MDIGQTLLAGALAVSVTALLGVIVAIIVYLAEDDPLLQRVYAIVGVLVVLLCAMKAWG